MENETIYILFLVAISVFISLIYMIYKYFEFKNEINFYWSELILDIFIFLIWLYIAKLFFIDESILWMNWWVAYIVIPSIISAIPMVIHYVYYPHIFWNNKIYFEVDTNNYDKALKLYEIKKEYINEDDKLNIIMYLAVWQFNSWIYDIQDWKDIFWGSKKWDELEEVWKEKIKKSISLFKTILGKDTYKEANKMIWFWYAELWNYEKSNKYLIESLDSNIGLTYKFEIITRILENNLRLKKLKESEILIEEYYKKLPVGILWNWEDYYLVQFLLIAANIYRDVWNNEEALKFTKKATEFEEFDEKAKITQNEIKTNTDKKKP
jgi:hypothetical protein